MAPRKNKPLPTAAKIMIVTQLACMETPSEVRDTIEKEYGIRCNLSTIVYYDPTTAESRLGDKWKDLFDKTRAKFLTDCGRVPIMHKAYRARMLQKLLDVEIDRKNTVGARETLEQAAKEEGGAFTNKRELTGKDGAPLAAGMTVRFVRPSDAKGNDDGR
jgi:hypothetical protein